MYSESARPIEGHGVRLFEYDFHLFVREIFGKLFREGGDRFQV